jgi:hypothetical protein
MSRKTLFSCKEQGRRTKNFVLLAPIDGASGMCVTYGAAVSHFDESQAVTMQHDQVDFTAATAEIPRDRL